MQNLKPLQKIIELLQHKIYLKDRLGILKLRQSTIKQHGHIQWQYVLSKVQDERTTEV
jgi:hypothetical protein